MARKTVEEVYGGEKHDVMSAVMVNYLTNGRLSEYNAYADRGRKMRYKGDSMLKMTDDEPSSSSTNRDAYGAA